MNRKIIITLFIVATLGGLLTGCKSHPHSYSQTHSNDMQQQSIQQSSIPTTSINVNDSGETKAH